MDRREALKIITGAALTAMAFTYAMIPQEGKDPFAVSPEMSETEPDNSKEQALQAGSYLHAAFQVQNDKRYGLYYKVYPREINQFASNWDDTHLLASALDLYILSDRNEYQGHILEYGFTGLWNYFDAYRHNDLPGYTAEVQLADTDGRIQDQHLLNDDCLWDALLLSRRYQLFGEATDLYQMNQILKLVRSEWDDNPNRCYAGGVHWDQKKNKSRADRNLVSTAPAAMLALKLYEHVDSEDLTEAEKKAKKADLLDFALNCYHWCNLYLHDPKTGLYFDRIEPDCDIDKSIFCYTQGIMMTVNTQLYKIIDDEAFLGEAQKIANASLEYFQEHNRLVKQDMAFVAIFTRHLLYLSHVTKNEYTGVGVRQLACEYLKSKWPKFIGSKAYNSTHNAQAIDQGAFVQLMAMTAMPPEKYKQLV